MSLQEPRSVVAFNERSDHVPGLHRSSGRCGWNWPRSHFSGSPFPGPSSPCQGTVLPPDWPPPSDFRSALRWKILTAAKNGSAGWTLPTGSAVCLKVRSSWTESPSRSSRAGPAPDSFTHLLTRPRLALDVRLHGGTIRTTGGPLLRLSKGVLGDGVGVR